MLFQAKWTCSRCSQVHVFTMKTADSQPVMAPGWASVMSDERPVKSYLLCKRCLGDFNAFLRNLNVNMKHADAPSNTVEGANLEAVS